MPAAKLLSASLSLEPQRRIYRAASDCSLWPTPKSIEGPCQSISHKASPWFTSTSHPILVEAVTSENGGCIQVLSVANAYASHASSIKFHMVTALYSDLQPTNPMQPYRRIPEENCLKLAELLDSLSSSGEHAENIESDLSIACQQILTLPALINEDACGPF